MLRGSVFRQFLSLGKAEQDHARIRRAQQGATDNSIRGEAGFPGKGDDLFCFGIDQWSFAHACKLAGREGEGFDARQGLPKN